MTRSLSTRAMTIALAAGSLASATSPILADDIYWVGYQNGCMVARPDNASFFHGDNWYNFVIPGPDDTVLMGTGFDPGGGGIPTYIHFGDFCVDVFWCPNPVFLPADVAQTGRLVIQSGDYTFDLGPGMTGSASCPAVPTESGRYEIVGSHEPLIIGDTIETTGLPGEASLTIRNGTLSAPFARLGNVAGSRADVLVDGAGAEFHFTSFPDIGYRGDATVRLVNGGQLTSDEWVSVGVHAGANGKLEVLGGRAMVDPSASGAIGSFRIGNEPGSDGTVTVDGPHSAIDVDGAINVGHRGRGWMTLAAGAQASVYGEPVHGGGILAVGSESGSDGTVTVDGPRSAIDVDGQIIIGGTGNGSMTLRAGAQATVYGDDPERSGLVILALGAGSNGVLDLRGGGTLLDSSHQIKVGAAGNGQLEIYDGAALRTAQSSSPTNSSGIIATDPQSTGEAIVDGAGSIWEQDGGLSVGFRGDGTLRITNGGTVQSLDGHIARFPVTGGAGLAELVGDDSSWHIDANLHIGGDEATASMRPAMLKLRDGGSVDVGATLRFWPTGALDTEIGEGGSPPLAVGGTAHLGGRLAVAIAPTYTPKLGDRHTIINAAEIKEEFEQFDLPAPPAKVTTRVLYSTDSVEVAFICRPDLDADGELTFFDFITFQTLFVADDPLADLTGDGTLDFFDFLQFTQEFAAGCD